MNKISASKARNNFSDLISKVEYQGQVFLIERYGEVAAKLVPVEKKEPVEEKSVKKEPALKKPNQEEDQVNRKEKVNVIRKRIKLMLE